MTSVNQRKPSKNEVSQTNDRVQLPERHASRLSSSLLTYNEIPTWCQDNPYIRTGYRPVSFSTPACFASWTYIHNETFNIYSHLLPAVFLLAQGAFPRLIVLRFPEASARDYVTFSFFLFTALVTLSISFTYHTLMNHSLRISHLWLRIDYGGIVCLTLGDFVSGIYVVFYCEPNLQKAYWAMVSPKPNFSTLRLLYFNAFH